MATASDKPYDLFVSYAAADRDWVEGYLLNALTQAGVRCHSEATFRLGVPRLEEFERAVRQSTRVLLVFSSAASFEGFAPFLEVLAQSYGAEAATWPVIPLLRAPVKLPTRLAMLTRLEPTDPAAWTVAGDRLCRELQRPLPGPAPRPNCPYPGMVPFGPREAGFFFGREAEIERGIQHLRHQRTLFVIGPSGSGKSSLIFAGLLPRLAQSSFFAPSYWVVRALRPGSAPLRALADVLGADPNQPDQAVAGLLARNAPAQRLLLLVDQLEELFTQTSDPAAQSQFLNALKGLRAVEHCALLIGMRADFYADLMNSNLWPVDPGQRLEISPLRGEALRQAIKRPAVEVGVRLEAGLVERLLADASDEPGVLPLLQETMVLLWDKMERRLIPYHGYEQLGQGGRSGLAVAMATKADATLADLTEPQQRIARRTLLRLVQFGEGRADTRRQQRLAELRSVQDDPAEFDRVLEHLTRHRLLTCSGEGDREDPVVDIAHEMLLIGWPRCQDWVQFRREAELVRRRLEAKTREWIRLGSGRGGLLDAVELAEAERWLASADAADLGYDQELAALVAASRARLDADRALARRRTRNTIVGLAAGLVLVTGLAVWAGYSAWRAGQAEAAANERRKEADRLRQLAVTQALAAQAVHQYTHGKRDERGALLARQAFLFNQRLRGPLLAEVDEALRVVLQDPYVSTVVPLGAVEATVTVMAFGPGHRHLAWAAVDGVLRVWDLHRPQDGPRLLRGHDKVVSALAFSSDGRWLASGGWDHTVRLWDLRQPSPAAVLPGGHKDIVVGLAFSRDGLSLASGSNDQTVRVWDLSRPQAGPRVLASTGLARALAFSDDGSRLAWGSYNGIDAGSAETWNLRQPDQAPVALPYKGGPIFSVAFSPNGHRLAAGSYGTLILWDLRQTPPPRVTREDSPPPTWRQLAVQPRRTAVGHCRGHERARGERAPVDRPRQGRPETRPETPTRRGPRKGRVRHPGGRVGYHPGRPRGARPGRGLQRGRPATGVEQPRPHGAALAPGRPARGPRRPPRVGRAIRVPGVRPRRPAPGPGRVAPRRPDPGPQPFGGDGPRLDGPRRSEILPPPGERSWRARLDNRLQRGPGAGGVRDRRPRGKTLGFEPAERRPHLADRPRPGAPSPRHARGNHRPRGVQSGRPVAGLGGQGRQGPVVGVAPTRRPARRPALLRGTGAGRGRQPRRREVGGRRPGRRPCGCGT